MGIKSEESSMNQLFGLDGVIYPVRLNDISGTGASLSMSTNVGHGLHVGEMCGFILRGNLKVPSTKHTGVIIKIDSDGVEISFNRQEHHHQKKKYTP